MGTRSVTYVKDMGTPLVAMYRQMDGYPTGMGADLKEFLEDKSLCNGFGIDADNTMLFNGLGCLSASLVAHFKDGIGGIYLQSVNEGLDYLNYVYEIYEVDDEIKLKVIAVSSGGTTVLYDGSVEEFDPEEVERKEMEDYENA